MVDEQNGRVTLAVLQRDLGHVKHEVEMLRADLARYLNTFNDAIRSDGERLRSLEIFNARQEERWDAHHTQHNRENSLTAIAGAIASALSAIAGIFINKP